MIKHSNIKKYIQFINELSNNVTEPDAYSSYMNKLPYKQRMQEFIDSIKTFDDLTDSKINDFFEYYGYEGFDTQEEAEIDIKEKIEFYKNLPNPCILYRFIGVKNKKMIKTDDLGSHYTPYKWNLDYDLLGSIGIDNWTSDIKPYIMEVSVPLSEINVLQTLIQNITFPNEHEINLKNNGKGAKLIKAYKY